MKLPAVIFSFSYLIVISILIPSLMFPSETQIISVSPLAENTACENSSCEDGSLILISHDATDVPSVASNSIIHFAAMPSFDGCSHGFWMQARHFDLWGDLNPEQSLESTFDVPDVYGLDHISLHDALYLKGGTSSLSAARVLLKEATAALLNSTNPELRYPLPMYQVLEDTNRALTSESQELMVLLAAQLQSYNRNGCPIQ